MSKIKRVEIKNYVGVKEFELDAAKINILKGPKGSSKSSVIEAVETTFTNSKRRTEVIRHGEDEATLYVELDDGLEINRKIRDNKADYLKVRKGDEGVPSTEKYLRSFLSGNIFRPIDWVNMDVKQQTKSILNMLQINWSQEDIQKWFGEIPSNVDFNQHILMVLKAIEMKYYKDREEVNRQTNELKTQIQVIKKDLPENYNGDTWREKKVQEYYKKVSDAQEINKWISEAKKLQENFKNKVDAIKANGESEKSRVKIKYKDQRQDIKDIIDLSNSKIEKANDIINNTAVEEENVKVTLFNEMEKEIQAIKTKYLKLETEKVEAIKSRSEEQKELISIQQNKIAAKQQELISLDELENQAIISVDEKIKSEVEKEELRVGKAANYLKEHQEIDIEPLQKEADEVSSMREYLHQWDKMIDIRDNQLSEKERYSADLTAKIETARTMPQELLKTAQMPIEGISVDEKGLIRINGTLIDGLSDGEKLTLAMKIAKAQAGTLKVICLDRFESLNPQAQQELLKEISEDEFQYFITSTMSDKFEIEKLN